MNRNQAKPVDRLSFDVLGEIFSHYAKEESIFHPLETLLLVSRSWSQAALGHRSLWGRLRICLGHDPCCQICMARLPLRLERSGSSTPLEIELWSLFSMRDKKQPSSNIPTYECPKIVRRGKSPHEDMCLCRFTSQDAFLPILEMLVGIGGENCRRWAHVDIDFFQFELKSQDSITRILSHPAPLLTHLTLTNLWTSGIKHDPGFPTSTPSLHHLCLHRYWVSNLPDLRNVRELSLNLETSDTMPSTEDWSALAYATRLEVLDLIYHDSLLVLPKELPYLWSLSLDAIYPPIDFQTLKAPCLRHIYLHVGNMRMFESIIQTINLPLQQVEEFGIGMRPLFHFAYEELLTLIPQIIQRMDGLKRISGDKRGVSLMMKMFWEADFTLGQGSWSELFVGREITFGLALERPSVMKYGVTVALKESGNRPDLSDAANSLCLVPLNLSREEIWEFIAKL